MKQRILLFLLTILIIGCSPTQRISVTNLHDLATYQPNSMIYALPRTRLAIEVELIHTHTVPGPYYAYAEKFLGIKGVPSVSFDEYFLDHVALMPFTEADPDYYYSLSSAKQPVVLPEFFSFCNEGLILNNQHYLSFSEFRSPADEDPEPIHFTDLSVKKHVSERNIDAITTAGENVPADLPVTKTKFRQRPLEEMAKEASDFIVKIRKRRFKLTAGQYEVFPEGTALETAVRELNELEEEYLALFVGKTYTDTISRTFFYTPEASQDIEREVVCRVSSETGFEDAANPAGKPLVLELKSLGNTNALKQTQYPQTGPVYDNVIFYRIPEKAIVRLFYGSQSIIEAEEQVFQYGPLVPYSLILGS